MEQGKKKHFFEVGVGGYLNLCNAKFSRIDVEKRVYKEVILSLHFSIASFNMKKFKATSDTTNIYNNRNN